MCVCVVFCFFLGSWWKNRSVLHRSVCVGGVGEKKWSEG